MYMPSYGESEERMHDVQSIYSMSIYPVSKGGQNLFAFVRGFCRELGH
jgi:hypothetical protein